MAIYSNKNKLDQTDRRTNKKKGGASLGGGYKLTNFDTQQFAINEIIYVQYWNFEYNDTQYFMVTNNDSNLRTDWWFNQYDLTAKTWSIDNDNEPALDGALDSVYLDGDFLYLNGDDGGPEHISINLDTLITDNGLLHITTGTEVFNTAIEIDGKSLTAISTFDASVGTRGIITPYVQVDNI